MGIVNTTSVKKTKAAIISVVSITSLKNSDNVCGGERYWETVYRVDFGFCKPMALRISVSRTAGVFNLVTLKQRGQKFESY